MWLLPWQSSGCLVGKMPWGMAMVVVTAVMVVAGWWWWQ